MAAEPCAGERELIGALVLGDLDPAEAARLRAHAEGCEGCRRELAALEPVARLLRRADADRVSAPAAVLPPGLAPRLSERLGSERRSRRRRAGFALAGATALAGVLAAAALVLPGGGGEATPAAITFDTGDPRVGLTASLTPRAWGTEVAVAVRGIEEGTRCRVWLVGEDGARVAAGSFRYGYGQGSDEAALTSALQTPAVESVEVKAGSRTYAAPLE